jgi:Cysteine-rich secretory protein family/K319L-like, PKD domain/Divergent InlB B-repeat domain
VRRTLYLIVFCFFLTSGHIYADFENDVIELVNIERSAEGLHPLNADGNLTEAARDHSEDMALQDYFSHTSLDGRTVPDRITAAGYSYNTYGENIAGGQPTPEDVIDAWMSSSGHRANILNPNFCDIGVGYAYLADSAYRHYWTQNFGRKTGVSSCPEISTYTITAAAGPGGGISPEGDVSVNLGANITFTFTPHPEYSVAAVIVDDDVKEITTNYLFSNVAGNHTIEATFSINQFPPVADAGNPQIVEEGETVTLDASLSSDPNDAVIFYEWSQISGSPVWLSDENDAQPTFVAGPITEDVIVVFQLTVKDSGGLSDSDTVEITMKENGLHNLPEDVITFHSTADKVMGLIPDSGSALVSLYPVDPASDSIKDRNGIPESLIYGLIDFKIKVDTPGDSTTVTILFPESVPEAYKWYKYNQTQGWIDNSANVSWNNERNQLSFILVDGGSGDDDGEQNGIIVDPSGLGLAPADSASTNINSSGGGSGGCFIETIFNISNMHEQL